MHGREYVKLKTKKKRQTRAKQDKQTVKAKNMNYYVYECVSAEGMTRCYYEPAESDVEGC